MRPTLLRTVAAALTFVSLATGAAAQSGPPAAAFQTIETRYATLGLHAGGGALWDYSAKGVDRRHAIAAPTFNLDGRDVRMNITAVSLFGAARDLPNGCREYSFVGDVAGDFAHAVGRLHHDHAVSRSRR